MSRKKWKTRYLIILVLEVLILPLLSSFNEVQAISLARGEAHMFTITGYYSPLPNQKFYVTGSYEAEIRLNGRGIAGADGTPVYPGMMAASPNFSYGTKVCVPSIGCGAVHDRGQAIVKKGERSLAVHDRLDIWMGYGDEGLLRALAWGVKSVECEIFSADSDIQEAVNFEAAMPIYRILNIPKKKFYNENLRHGMEGHKVEELQRDMKRIGFYSGNVDGIYDFDLKNAVFKFQKKHFLVQTESDKGAGHFGPGTRKKMADEKHRFEIQEKIREAWETFHFEDSLSKGAKNTSVLKLQEMLVELEYLDAYPTGYFGPQTEQALRRFQLDHEIIKYEFAYGAGRVGPKTRDKLNELLEGKKDTIEDEKAAIIAYGKTWDKVRYLASKNFNVETVLAVGDSGENVTKLQVALKNLGYIDTVPTGFYGDATKDAIQQFQLDYGVIFSLNDNGSGVFGPYTREVLSNVLNG